MDAATTALRADRHDATSARGLARDQWDAVYDPTVYDAFVAWLFTQPAARRAAAKDALVTAVLAGLPAGFPEREADAAALDRGRRDFADRVAQLS